MLRIGGDCGDREASHGGVSARGAATRVLRLGVGDVCAVILLFMQYGINVPCSINQFPTDPIITHDILNRLDIAVKNGEKLRTRRTVRHINNPHIPGRVFGKRIITVRRKIISLYLNSLVVFRDIFEQLKTVTSYPRLRCPIPFRNF